MSDIFSLQMVHALADNAKENIFAAKKQKVGRLAFALGGQQQL